MDIIHPLILMGIMADVAITTADPGFTGEMKTYVGKETGIREPNKEIGILQVINKTAATQEPGSSVTEDNILKNPLPRVFYFTDYANF
jgi:hypothetical protein